MLLPLLLKCTQNLRLAFCVDDMYVTFLSLKEAINAMHRLNKVVELESYS